MAGTISDLPIQRVLLVGFMAAGKTSVGEELADRLGWRHVDIDAAVEAMQGRQIADIFRDDGEAHFRRLEAAATALALRQQQVIVSPGGGWAEHARLWDDLPEGTLSVWLKITPNEVARRIRPGHGPARPVIEGLGQQAIRELLAHRSKRYAMAELQLDTDGRTIEDIAAEIELYVRVKNADFLREAPED